MAGAFNIATESLATTEAHLDTHEATDAATEQVINAIQSAIEAGVLMANITSKSKPGFNEKCKQACSETQKRRRLFQQLQANRGAPPRLIGEAKARWKAAGRKKKKMIRNTLKNTHREKVE